MKNLLNTPIPAVGLKKLSDQGVETVPTQDFFRNKRVVVVGIPGAYTPLCSSRHIPEFVQSADDIKAKGFDDIVCLSVNDPFVMRAWSKDLKAENKLTFLADADGSLTKALDLELDAKEAGLGTRCQRFAMVVDNGVITSLYLEPDVKACTVSSAQAILAALDQK